MLCYKDKCFCSASIRFEDATGVHACHNKKCDHHMCNVPFDKLPEWLPIAWADFHEKCGKCQLMEREV